MGLSRRGISSLEVVFILVAVVAGLVMMQIYLKRAIQGRLRSLSDGLSQRQYSPGNVTSDWQTTITINSAETSLGGVSNATFNETTTIMGNETISRQ
jgi:hypothetical protein